MAGFFVTAYGADCEVIPDFPKFVHRDVLWTYATCVAIVQDIPKYT